MKCPSAYLRASFERFGGWKVNDRNVSFLLNCFLVFFSVRRCRFRSSGWLRQRLSRHRRQHHRPQRVPSWQQGQRWREPPGLKVIKLFWFVDSGSVCSWQAFPELSLIFADETKSLLYKGAPESGATLRQALVSHPNITPDWKGSLVENTLANLASVRIL
jgi:hypothetical protein